jgi:hypothetical protein
VPHSSLAYKTVLTKPPDGRPHPAPHVPCRPRSSQVLLLIITLRTLYWVITGHAFIGSYMRRFFPQHTWEQVACPCSEPVQTVEHVLLDCPMHTATHCKQLPPKPLNFSTARSVLSCCYASWRKLVPARSHATTQYSTLVSLPISQLVLVHRFYQLPYTPKHTT